MYRFVLILFIFISGSLFSQSEEWYSCDDCEYGKIAYKIIDPFNFIVTAKVRIDANISTVFSVVTDLNTYPKWIYNVYQVDLIENRGDYAGLYYMLIEAPFPLNDIDATMEYEVKSDTSNNSFSLVQSCIPFYYDFRGDFQRVTRYKAIWKFRPMNENTTELIYIVKLGGPENLPGFLLKVFLCQSPTKTIENLNSICSQSADN